MGVSNLIIDTGALVAVFDPSEGFHASCAGFLRNFEGRIITTEAILTESLYMLGNSFENQKKCIQFFLRSVRLVPINSERLARMLELMEKNQDTPMDFADATLVALAEDLECPEIFTLRSEEH